MTGTAVTSDQALRVARTDAERVYRDLGEPSRYVERFIVSSWADYLHQRARATVADQALESGVRHFLAPGEQAQMSHYVAER